VLTLVFGESQLDNNRAVVSTVRLAESIYGMLHRDDLLRDSILNLDYAHN
jgi:predicted Zn-dependent protease